MWIKAIGKRLTSSFFTSLCVFRSVRALNGIHQMVFGEQLEFIDWIGPNADLKAAKI